MAWIILEGLDRTGKSTVAELYKRSGYEVVHFNAPDKKYLNPDYSGPSYLDEIVDLYMKYNGKDVVFDRSVYGEFVWPFVYNRKSQLTKEDLEVLQDFESQNMVERYLLYDAGIEAHWKRCVDNKEPLTRAQFNQANVFFDKMARTFNFEKKQLSDFGALQKSVTVDLSQNEPVRAVEQAVPAATVAIPAPKPTETEKAVFKLETANAINDILSKRIIKSKGTAYDALEKEVRDFLGHKLSTIFGEDKSEFSQDEVQILKIYVKQLKQKLESKK